MKIIYIKLFLRVSIAIGFISAVADRFGFWSKENSAWGTWGNFLEYTKLLNPWAPESIINVIGIIATLAEVLLSIFLLIGFKTSLFAKASGVLLLIFGISMTITLGIKAPLDYSVFSASAAAFGLSLIKEKYLEIDQLF
ncbi:DoxX family protein [Aquimarina sp. AD1]|uniref:DoxX family protein n=1 Tax=Aquimarina sp. (strain AD1) TaxID=1714848 RepID=UPI000E4F8DF5|nr:DoxX family protein [Aquimarina sp. AD1]AXT56459.1 DoxX family protein [Aquimarina sp. AD1]RKN17469.1 DoxX family protein [Aquimarina sp. AD1]